MAMFSLRLHDSSSRINIYLYNCQDEDLENFKPIRVTHRKIPKSIFLKNIPTYMSTRRAEIILEMANDITVYGKLIFYIDADTIFLRKINSNSFPRKNAIYLNITANTDQRNRVFLSHFILNLDESVPSGKDMRAKLNLWQQKLEWPAFDLSLDWFDDQVTFAKIFMNTIANSGTHLERLESKYGAYGRFLNDSYLISGAGGSKTNTAMSITPYGVCSTIIIRQLRKTNVLKYAYKRKVLKCVISFNYLMFIYLSKTRLLFSKIWHYK
jgi:hypothetical protein